MNITLEQIKALDAEDKSLTFELTAAVGLYVKDNRNSFTDRAEALRVVCQYMPRKQGDLSDKEFVNTFLRGEEFKG